MSRPEVRGKFRSLTDDLVNRFLDAMQTRSIWMTSVPGTFKFERDPKDEPYINLAMRRERIFLSAGAKIFWISQCRPPPDWSTLRELAPDLRILPPAEFLREMREMAAARARSHEGYCFCDW